eukprot:833846-Alexandrium_andersonii.AAC.1
MVDVNVSDNQCANHLAVETSVFRIERDNGRNVPGGWSSIPAADEQWTEIGVRKDPDALCCLG